MGELHAERGGAVELSSLGALAPISRSGGQGRVYAPLRQSAALGPGVVVKLYRSAPPTRAAQTLAAMVDWRRQLAPSQRAALERVAAWPLATVLSRGTLAGIAMPDVSSRFTVPFLMPSGRTAPVLLQLEHMLGDDRYLLQRGLPIALDTPRRAQVAERICAAFAFLHRQAIVVSDVSPSNVLLSLEPAGPAQACLIDCDSMVFRGRQALESVETGDWQMPRGYCEPPLTRAADAYKLGLVVLRLFARSHDAREPAGHLRHLPAPLRTLLERALSPDAANRPPAGEWQLALARLVEDEALAARYPGPAPVRDRSPARPPAPTHRTRQPASAGAPPRGALRASAAPPASAVAASGRNSSGARHGGAGMRGFGVAWLVVGVLLLLLFARLLALETQPAGAGSALERQRDVVTLAPGEGPRGGSEGPAGTRRGFEEEAPRY